jgi:competence protein ComEC
MDWFARWIEAERGRFLLLIPVALGASILTYFALPTEPPLWTGPLACAVSAAALLVPHPYVRFAAVLALAASLGFARAELRTASAPPMPIIPTGILRLTGTIDRIERFPTTTRLTLASPQLDTGPAQTREVRIKLRPNDPAPLAAGEQVAVYAMLFPPDRPAVPGGWDMGRDYFFANLAASGFALNHLTVIAPPPPNAFADALQTLRANIAATIAATLPPNTAGIAITLLTGDEQAIPDSERQDFVTAGLAHILAVAGLHVGIVMGLAFAATSWLVSRAEYTALRWPNKPLSAAAALAAGAAYALLTGAHLPILRSLAMASLATVGIFAGRRAVSLRGLALAATVLLLTTPEAILSASFQMSFSAVAALITGYAAARHLLSRLKGGSHHLVALAFTSLLAGGASMPFAAYQFQQLQPYWIPANLLAVPLTGLWILPLGLLSLLLMPLHLAWLALIPMGWGIALIVWTTSHIAAWPGALIHIPAPPDAMALLFGAGLVWLTIWRSPPRFFGLALMAAGLVAALLARPPDVLVSDTAGLIAIRSGATVFLVTQPHASKFTLAQWQYVWGETPLTPASCTAESCLVGQVWFTTQPACAAAPLIVAPLEMPACPGAVVIDRLATYQNGAMAAWITPQGVTLRTDRSTQGDRPWVPPYPQL